MNQLSNLLEAVIRFLIRCPLSEATSAVSVNIAHPAGDLHHVVIINRWGWKRDEFTQATAYGYRALSRREFRKAVMMNVYASSPTIHQHRL